MKNLTALVVVSATLALINTRVCATESASTRVLSQADISAMSPALGQHAGGTIQDLWKREALNKRDRSIVTITALIARNHAVELRRQLPTALDNGVMPSEVSEIITHLAFYSGWGNAMSAIVIARDVFAERKIDPGQLPSANGNQLPLDETAEKQRQERVGKAYGDVSPGLVQYTTDVLFLDLWLRPALKPRDRSLVTVSALIAAGQTAQLGFHLNKAMDNGLTQVEAGEVITQLAFFAGWPRAFSAMAAAKEVFAKRSK